MHSRLRPRLILGLTALCLVMFAATPASLQAQIGSCLDCKYLDWGFPVGGLWICVYFDDAERAFFDCYAYEDRCYLQDKCVIVLV